MLLFCSWDWKQDTRGRFIDCLRNLLTLSDRSKKKQYIIKLDNWKNWGHVQHLTCRPPGVGANRGFEQVLEPTLEAAKRATLGGSKKRFQHIQDRTERSSSSKSLKAKPDPSPSLHFAMPDRNRSQVPCRPLARAR